MYDCIIIGGGISGITAAVYLKHANKKVLLIEKSALGGILNKISKIENYPGYKSVTGPDLAYNLYEQVKYNEIEVLESTVISIENQGNTNLVKLKDKELTCKYLILATGKEARKLNLENEDRLVGRGISYCALCDGPFFRNKEVAVIGAGDSALLEALYLSNICSHITIINKYSKFKCKETLLNQVLKKENITILYDSMTKSLNEENGLLKSITYMKDEKEEELQVSGAFVYIGSTPNIFDINLELDGNYIKVNEDMETSIERIYAIGDVIKKDIYQLTNAASEGMIAATNIIKRLNKE
ncbi:MAG: FAD-dependent oxidoreductase [Bacilli bacterium]|nr:FAD-dependent oxidoreductase [Bacilli bacterium]